MPRKFPGSASPERGITRRTRIRPSGGGPPGEFGRAIDSLAPHLVAAPFVILGAVLVLVNVLRVWVWISDRRATAAIPSPGRESRT